MLLDEINDLDFKKYLTNLLPEFSLMFIWLSIMLQSQKKNIIIHLQFQNQSEMKQNKSLVALLKEMDQTECEDHIFIDQSTENEENTLLGHRPASSCTITRV